MKRVSYVAAVLAVVAIGIALYMGTAASAAPNTTFVLLDGSSKTTNDLKGRVTLVNFWATSCAACVAQMPKIVATHDTATTYVVNKRGEIVRRYVGEPDFGELHRLIEKLLTEA